MKTERVTSRSVTTTGVRTNVYKAGYGPDRFVVPWVNYYYPPIFDRTDVFTFGSSTFNTVATYYLKDSVDTPGWRDLLKKKVSKIKSVQKNILKRSVTVPRLLLPKVKFRGNFSFPSKWPQPLDLMNSFPTYSFVDLVRFYYREFIIYELANARRDLEYNVRQSLKIALATRDFLSRTRKFNRQQILRTAELARLKRREGLNVKRSSMVKTLPENPFTEFFIQFRGSSVPSLVSVSDQYPYTPKLYYTWLHQHNQLTGANDTALKADMYRVAQEFEQLLKPTIDEMENKLSRKFWDKLGNQRVHLGNIIAERVKTFDTLTSLVQRIASLLKSKKSLFKSLSSYALSPKKLASDFLAFKFGLEPLYGDIVSSAEKLYDLSSGQEVSVVVRTLSRKAFTLINNGLTLKGTISIAYVVKYDVDFSNCRTLQELGLVNPAEIAWELAPWSFVIDWFTPIGAFISQYTADTGMQFNTGTRTVRINLDATPTTPAANVAFSDGSVYLHGDYVAAYKRRVVLSGPPNRFELYTKSPFSWTHSAEALALLIQKLKR